MNGPIDKHLAELKSISQAVVPLHHSDQLSRYYWLPDSQVPDRLSDSEPMPAKVRSDYGAGCRDTDRYWRKRLQLDMSSALPWSDSHTVLTDPMIMSDADTSSKWKLLGKRDNVSRVMIDPQLSGASSSSLYSDSFGFSVEKRVATTSIARTHHIKSNPISKFGEALLTQHETMRHYPCICRPDLPHPLP